MPKQKETNAHNTKQKKQSKPLNPNAPPWTPDKQDTPNPLSTKHTVANYKRKRKTPSD